MVTSKRRTILQFLVFVGPAFLFYYLFFINPFFQGFLISLTNWDGITSKTPISVPVPEFETTLLDKISSPQDKEFLLDIYKKDEQAKTYNRTELTGFNRARVQGILASTGYEPENYKFVGFGNYQSVFEGRINPSFYPRTGELYNFQEQSFLPNSLEAKVINLYLEKYHANPEALELLSKYYQKASEKTYRLNPDLYEFEIQQNLRNLTTLDQGLLEGYMKDLAKAGLTGQRDTVSGLKSSLEGYTTLSPENKVVFDKATDQLYEMSVFKKLLSQGTIENKYQLGVLGFTFLFTVLTVILSNFLAFMVALALDKKLKSKNFLRSVFFLPNIISLVIVAFIWSLIFGQLLPRITPIEVWMSNPDIAPYLVVLVAVWQGLGYYMVIYLAGLQSIPQEILEVASVDGASSLNRLINITIPLLMPAFTICLFLSIANALKAFDIVFALVGPSGYTVNAVPVVMDIYYDAFARKLAGLSTAKAILLMLFIVIITGIQLTIMKKKEVEY